MVKDTVVRELYRASGWPDQFNLTAFEAAKTRSANYTKKTWEVEEPVHLVRWLDDHIEGLERALQELKINQLGLGPPDRNQKALDIDSGTAQHIEISDAFIDRLDRTRTRQESRRLGVDEEIMRQEVKLAAAKEELRAAERRMDAVGLARDDLPPSASYVDQQATAAYMEFQRTHNV